MVRSGWWLVKRQGAVALERQCAADWSESGIESQVCGGKRKVGAWWSLSGGLLAWPHCATGEGREARLPKGQLWAGAIGVGVWVKLVDSGELAPTDLAALVFLTMTAKLTFRAEFKLGEGEKLGGRRLDDCLDSHTRRNGWPNRWPTARTWLLKWNGTLAMRGVR